MSSQKLAIIIYATADDKWLRNGAVLEAVGLEYKETLKQTIVLEVRCGARWTFFVSVSDLTETTRKKKAPRDSERSGDRPPKEHGIIRPMHMLPMSNGESW